jgi:predicted hydrocarbon binding protein
MSTTVDALLPLSFLEAVRNVDSPDGDLDAEFVPELRNKRLGLSETVYAQIRRYTEAAKRHQRTVHEEAVGIAKLIGRRPDAEAVFRAAGRYLADQTYEAIPGPTRRLIASVPSLVARPVALRQIRRIAERYLNGSVRRLGAFVILEIPRSATVDSGPRGVGCAYYEAFLRELLSLFGASGESVDHVRCAARGEGSCEWRAEWRAVAPTEAAGRAAPEAKHLKGA